MTHRIMIYLTALFFILGCAKVQVHAPKEPIKVDIAMRVDVYQHVEKDIDAIEDIVSGKKAPARVAMLDLFAGVAYAAEGLSAEAEQAALRRQTRYDELMSAESEGRVGENASGYVVVRGAGDGYLEGLVSAENKDRMVIYNAIAEKNKTSVAGVQKLYAQKLRESAPPGTPVQSDSGEWRTK